MNLGMLRGFQQEAERSTDSGGKDKRYGLVLPIVMMMILLCSVGNAQVSHTIALPQVYIDQQYTVLSPITSASNVELPVVSNGFTISKSIYESNRTLLVDEIYNSTYYTESRSCFEYRTTPIYEMYFYLSLSKNILQSAVSSDSKKLILLLDADISTDTNETYPKQNIGREIHFYNINNATIVYSKNIAVSSLGLDDNYQLEIKILTLGRGTLYVTNGKQIVAYDLIKETFQMMKLVGEPVAGFIHEENQLLKFELIVKLEDKNPLKFFMVWSTLIVVYSFKGDDFNVFTTISAPKYVVFRYVIYYSMTFYALIDKVLLIYYNEESNIKQQGIYLESHKCTSLTKIGSTLYIVCEEAGKRYVAEMYISNSAPNVRLALNQYFTTLDDVNRVIPFGKLKDQLLLIGDEEFMMTTFAVNRHVLLDLGLPQPRTKYESFASEYVWYLEEDLKRNSSMTSAIGVAANFFFLFRIDPGYLTVECSFNMTEAGKTVSLLIVANTTSCLKKPIDGGLSAICQVIIPYIFYVPLVKITEHHGIIMGIVIAILLLGLVLLLIGCCCKHRRLRQSIMRNIQKKIDKLKKKNTYMKPL